MSKKDYELIAGVLNRCLNATNNEDAKFGIDLVIRELGFDFEVDNDAFDIEKFYEAAGVS